MTWAVAGWWLTQVVLFFAARPASLAALHDGNALSLSVVLGIVGSWCFLVLCGMFSNRTSYAAGGCLGFFAAWFAVGMLVFLLGCFCRVSGFVIAEAVGLGGPLGLWLMGQSRLSLLVVGALLGTSLFYATWDAWLSNLTPGGALWNVLFLLGALIAQMALARMDSSASRQKTPSDDPWQRSSL